jgi:hypothetical protein
MTIAERLVSETRELRPLEILPENGVPDPFGNLFSPRATRPAIIHSDIRWVLGNFPAGSFIHSSEL